MADHRICVLVEGSQGVREQQAVEAHLERESLNENSYSCSFLMEREEENRGKRMGGGGEERAQRLGEET